MDAATHAAALAEARRRAAEKQQWRDIAATCRWCRDGNRPERAGANDWRHTVRDRDTESVMRVWCAASAIREQD